ncbi:hypothetical protein PSI23_20345, partial [Xenorhabdus sp. XENO-10]
STNLFIACSSPELFSAFTKTLLPEQASRQFLIQNSGYLANFHQSIKSLLLIRFKKHRILGIPNSIMR